MALSVIGGRWWVIAATIEVVFCVRCAEGVEQAADVITGVVESLVESWDGGQKRRKLVVNVRTESEDVDEATAD
jgi:hypothetical protein